MACMNHVCQMTSVQNKWGLCTVHSLCIHCDITEATMDSRICFMCGIVATPGHFVTLVTLVPTAQLHKLNNTSAGAEIDNIVCTVYAIIQYIHHWL